MPVDVKVKRDQDEKHSDTEILVEEEDDFAPEPVVEEPCGVVDRAKGWMANFLLGRTSQCVQRQTYPPVETVRVIYQHVHKHPNEQLNDNDRLLLDQQNGPRGYRKAHRWGKDKAAEWRDGVRREGHEWKEGIKQQGHEWKEGLEREGHHVADQMEGYWDRAKQEGQELEDELEDAADFAKGEARYAADQVKDKASQTMENLRSSVRRIPTKAKEEMDRVDDFVKDKLNSAKEAAATATDYAKAESERIMEGAERIKNDVEDTIDNVKNNVKDTVREGVNTVNNAATHAKKAAKEKLHHAHNRIHQAGHEVKEDIQGAFNKVENAAGHTWHKFEECLGCPPRRKDLSTFRRDDLNGRGYRYLDRPYGWNPVPITAFYTAVSTLWFLWLVRKVWFARRKAKVPAGDGSWELAREVSKDVTATTINGGVKGRHVKSASPPQSDDEEPLLTSTTVHTHVAVEKPSRRLAQLVKAVDARNTYAMNTAFLLALMAIMELNHAARPLLHVMFITYVLSNLAQSSVGRHALGENWTIGPAGTFGLLLFAALSTIYYSLNCQASF